MKQLLPPKYRLAIHAISAIVALLIHFPEWMVLTDLFHELPLPGIHLKELLGETFFAYLSLLVLFHFNAWLFRLQDPMVHCSWRKLVLAFLLTWFLSSLMGQGFIWVHHHFGIPAIDAQLHQYLHPLRDLLNTLIVTGCSYLFHLDWKSHNMQLENEQLRTENLRNQFESLKSQLNPHMLFNSLNTLYSLIREEPEKAEHFVQELSKVLRYTLQDNETHCVTLQEEMAFVRSYLYLLEMRYEDNLHFKIDIDSTLMACKLPPMSVQLLIENAVKHNEISNRRPLTITIQNEGKQLRVSHVLQPKRSGHNGSTGIGLSNLNQRFQLLFQREIEVKEENHCFIVTLPLA